MSLVDTMTPLTRDSLIMIPQIQTNLERDISEGGGGEEVEVKKSNSTTLCQPELYRASGYHLTRYQLFRGFEMAQGADMVFLLKMCESKGRASWPVRGRSRALRCVA